MPDNPYLAQVRAVLPRLLALFDSDRTSPSHGLGDRYHWAWGLMDFGNATYQGAANGMARLWRSGLWPYPTTRAAFLDRLDAMFAATRRLARRDGSLEEAFPREGSFCVTALVAYDLLSALELMAPETDEATRSRWLEAVRPLIRYVLNNDETHALISNHLATAAAALARWCDATPDREADARGRDLLERILRHQSAEGWFREYQGADPGYQSLCTCYLADLHRLRPQWGLAEPLARSVRFLWHFAHPDGSFGGYYGSRSTRFYHPAGIALLAPEIPEAAALADFMRASVASRRVVTLDTMDEPNLVPMFNAYCWSAELGLLDREAPPASAPRLPCLRKRADRISFPEAGLVIDSGPTHYTIVNTHLGGVVQHYRDGSPALCNAGVVVRGPGGGLGSTQSFCAGNVVLDSGAEISIEASVSPMPRRLPTPAAFLLLRALSLTAFRSRRLREMAKRWLVRLLITRRHAWPVRNLRRIRLGPEITISDDLQCPRGYQPTAAPGPFLAIHMASQGYWQIQDEDGA